jgi:uncharacterized protein (TIGR02271 family)
MDREDERDMKYADDDTHTSSTAHDGESHATTGGAAAAGAVTGGVIGLTGGPVGAAIGAVGGAIVGAAAERMMHSDDDAERAQAGLDNDHDANPFVENRAEADARSQTTFEHSPTPARGTDTNLETSPSMTRGADTIETTPSMTRDADADLETTPTLARGTDTSFETTSPMGRGTDAPSDRVQLREEQLQARTTPVEAGHVTVGKEVVEEQRTIEVPVAREEAVIERHAVDRRPSDEPIGESGRSVDMPVYEERVTAEKQPVVYEEVGVGKRQFTDTQQVSDTVRREEARVNTEGDARTRDTTSER